VTDDKKKPQATSSSMTVRFTVIRFSLTGRQPWSDRRPVDNANLEPLRQGNVKSLSANV
jgi:hypothetical protein